MRVVRPVLLFVMSAGLVAAQDVAGQARQLETKGDPAAARAVLERAAKAPGANGAVLTAYADFLAMHRDPGARDAYENALTALRRSGDDGRRAEVARRMILLDLIADDRTAAVRHMEEYRAAGGSDFTPPASTDRSSTQVEARRTVQIPGPLRSFARMAALSPDLSPEDLLPALARNIVINGYQASSSNEALDQTEYLKLVVRYLSQARELDKLAGQSKTIQIETCDSPQTGELLRVLGYRMRGGCGAEVVLETVNATRAFLTIDSGFPLATLEQALRTNHPFTYDYRPTQAPVMFVPEYWLSAREKQTGEFIDAFIGDPALCRLYLGFSKLDRDTAEALRKGIPVQRIKAFAHVLDYFGGMFQVEEGRAVVPGAPRTHQAWSDMVGASPDNGVQFFERLMSRDDGWLASYFDALSRINGPLKDYLTEPSRLKRYYQAVRGKITSPGPARPVFRSNTDMLLLTTRLQLDPSGKPHVPGSLEIWRNLFVNHPHGKYDGKLAKAALSWKDPDDLIEALFGLCRKAVENEPLKIFMSLSDIDRRRTKPLETATVDRLAHDYRILGSQYVIFNDAPSLSDKTILEYLDTAQSISQVKDGLLRADTAGTMQALVGLWQIFSRQGSIAPADADGALSAVLDGFVKVHNQRELFDSGRSGVKALLTAANARADASPQDSIIDLLSGAGWGADSDAHRQVMQDTMRIFEAQRLVSLKTLFDLADNLERLSRGEKINTQLVNRLAARIAEVQLPRAALSSTEKSSFAFGYWTERHIENQRKVNLRALIEKAGSDPEKVRDIRGQLAPMLRDALVGFVYAHYAPPGAQIIYTNPLFVRSHDFLGVQGQTWRPTEVFGTGWPSSAGGRLVGSLATLPYALAEAEQNFLIPSREQALIWGDLVPQMILSAKINRWWSVTPAQLHWLGLHMRYSECLLAESALNPARRREVITVLAGQAFPSRVKRIAQLLEEGRVRAALETITPSEQYVLAVEMLNRKVEGQDPVAGEIRRLAAASPEQLNSRAISRAFGTPKPTLANSYQPELLNLRTFPTLMGYSSRVMAESWESSILYYGALADELGISPSQLNVVIPEWTQKTVERIFATHLEDWPALLRSLRLVGDDVRAQARRQMAAEQKAVLN